MVGGGEEGVRHVSYDMMADGERLSLCSDWAGECFDCLCVNIKLIVSSLSKQKD